jgi:NADPH:quinone reductase-like Zn-dependent oxidoreductase
MSASASTIGTMRTVRFHGFGEPAEVLRLEEMAIPEPGADRIRIRVHACGLNPADGAHCRGLFPGSLPRGIGLEMSGMVDAIGEGVTDVTVDDPVLGMADFADYPSAGVSDYANVRPRLRQMERRQRSVSLSDHECLDAGSVRPRSRRGGCVADGGRDGVPRR